MNKKTYSSAEVCKLCNMSRKKLRYYEERGLLQGVLRGEENNYRYYMEGHINELLIKKELQNSGFSLNEIVAMSLDSSLNGIYKSVKKRMLNAKEELKQSMMRYEQSTEKYFQLLEAVSFLKIQLADADIDPEEENYKIIDYPSQDVVALSYEGTFLDAERSFFINLAKLYTIIEEYGITTLASLTSIYHNHYDSVQCAFHGEMNKVEICMPVVNMKKPCPYYKKIEGFRGVITKHIGSYNVGLDATYVKLLKWAKKQGYKLANTSVEDALISPLLTTNDAYWVTNIMIPFES